MYLETDRLVLRAFQPADAEVFSAYRSDPEVARYQGWETPYSLAQARDFIEIMQRVKPGTRGAWCQIALQLKTTGDLIGDCAFQVLADVHQQAEIGFSLARHYQGQGYMTEAARRLLTFLFEEFSLHRVRAICDMQNTASARVLERLGMRREGYFIDSYWFKGRWTSEYWYAILRREWEAAAGVSRHAGPV